MNLLRALFERRSLATPPKWLQDLLVDTPTAAGVQVSERNAETIAAVYRAVSVLAGAVATLPLKLYRRADDGGREEATDHPLYGLLHDRPNPLMTSVMFREALMRWLLLYGNAYAEIEYGRDGTVRALWPLPSDIVSVEVDLSREPVDLKVRYRVRLESGGEKILPRYAVLHIRALGTGLVGLSPVRLMRETLGVAKAAEQYGAKVFANDASVGVVLSHPAKLSDEAVQRIRRQWTELHAGLSNAHRVAVLEEGMKAERIGLPPEDAQFLQTRQFEVAEIARIFGVPPHLLFDLSRGTYSNNEQLSLEFLQHSLRPWLVRWEQEIQHTLLLPSERGRYYAEFVVDGLLRADTESRYRAYAIGRQWGWLSANDVRRRENMPPIEGGDTFLVPLNMLQTGPGGTRPVDPERAAPAAVERRDYRVMPEPEIRQLTRLRVGRTYERLLEDVWRRIVRREVADVRRMLPELQAGRLAVFGEWLKRWSEDELPGWIYERYLPLVQALAEFTLEATREELPHNVTMEDIQQEMDSYARVAAHRHAGDTAGQLEALVRDEDDPVAAVEQRLVEWEEQRPAKEARRERVRATNAFAKIIFVAAGVTRLVWRNTGSESCPYCQRMDGRIVGVSEWFALPGEDLGGMRVFGRIGHPPLHDGCDCVILPETGRLPRAQG